MDDFSDDVTTTGTLVIDGPATDANIDFENDRDWFAIEVTAGQIIEFEVIGIENLFSNRIEIFGPDGTSILTSSNSFTNVTNPIVQYEFEESGTHYVQIASASENDAQYSVTATEIFDDFDANIETSGVLITDGVTTGVINFENDHDWFRLDVTEAGDIIRFFAEGASDNTLFNTHLAIYDSSGRRVSLTPDGVADSLGQPTAEIAHQFAEAGTYFVGFTASNLFGDYEIITSQVTDDFGQNISTNGILPTNGDVISGELQFFSDEDWLAFDVDEAGTILSFTLDRVDGPSAFSLPDLHFYDSNGELIATRFSSNPGQTIYDFGFSEAGRYYVEISDRTSFLQSYEISATQVGTDDFLDNANTSGQLSLDGGQVFGSIEFETDRDWFAFNVDQNNQHVQFSFSGRVDVLGGIDLGEEAIDLSIYSGDGVLLRTFHYDSSEGPLYNFDHVFEDTGQYFVELTFSNIQDAIGTYNLEAITPTDITELSAGNDVYQSASLDNSADINDPNSIGMSAEDALAALDNPFEGIASDRVEGLARQ